MALSTILENYQDEMIAEGAWSGHTYAAEYLANIKADLISALTEIVNRYSYERGYLYKDGQMCNSANEKSIWDNAKHGLFLLENDYQELITEVYNIDSLTSDKKHIIAESLDNDFRTKLQEAVEDATRILDAGYERKAENIKEETDEEYSSR